MPSMNSSINYRTCVAVPGERRFRQLRPRTSAGDVPLGGISAGSRRPSIRKQECTHGCAEHAPAHCRQVVDVQAAARAAGWPRVGLQGLATELLGMAEFKKSRNMSMCNWAAREMSEKQASERA
jgi:hypothetical protein